MTRKQMVASVVLGMAGVAVALGVYHVYTDHRDFHVIRTAIVQAQAAKAKLPMPTPDAGK